MNEALEQAARDLSRRLAKHRDDLINEGIRSHIGDFEISDVAGRVSRFVDESTHMETWCLDDQPFLVVTAPTSHYRDGKIHYSLHHQFIAKP